MEGLKISSGLRHYNSWRILVQNCSWICVLIGSCQRSASTDHLSKASKTSGSLQNLPSKHCLLFQACSAYSEYHKKWSPNILLPIFAVLIPRSLVQLYSRLIANNLMWHAPSTTIACKFWNVLLPESSMETCCYHPIAGLCKRSKRL